MTRVLRKAAAQALGSPSEVRMRLERMGPIFVKVGQFLALRPDVLPQAYCDELMRLFDRVPAAPWPEMERVFVEEFQRRPEAVFETFATIPVASGSLAQTYRGTLPDGTVVAVKIQRPGLEDRIREDLKKLARWGQLLDLGGSGFPFSLRDTFVELERWLLQEVDFRRELESMRTLRRLGRESDCDQIPKAFAEFSSRRVLTCEFLEGIPVTELLEPLGANKDALGSIDRPRFARHLLSSVLRQIFEHQYFHADPHPGNLIALPGDRVGFVDFGLCDHLDPEFRAHHLRYLTALYEGGDEQIVRAFEDLLMPTAETDPGAFRLDFLHELRRWRDSRAVGKEASSSTASGSKPAMAEILVRAFRLAHQHRFQVPPRLLSMYRALLASVSVAYRLGDTEELNQMARAYFGEVRRRETRKAVTVDAAEHWGLALLQLCRQAPEDLLRLLSELSDGRYQFQVASCESPREARLRNRRTRLVAGALLAISVAVLLTIPQLPRVLGVELRSLLWTTLGLVYSWCLWQWLRLR